MSIGSRFHNSHTILRFFLSFVFRVRVKMLHAFVVKGVALLTTKVIMNVSASIEAPRKPAKSLVHEGRSLKNFYVSDPKRTIEPIRLDVLQ